jgi:hypothetical protein
MMGIGLLLVCVILATQRVQQKDRRTQQERRMRSVEFIMNGLRMMDGVLADETRSTSLLPPLQLSTSDGKAVGWRLVWSVHSLADAPSPSVGRQSSEFDLYDDMSCKTFCWEPCKTRPRGSRFTKVMAIDGADSAYNQIRLHGWRQIEDIASDAILLTEVVNSTVPWMAAGDVAPDRIPRTIHPKDGLGIGSNRPNGGFIVGFVDGEVWAIDESVPFEQLLRFLTVSGARKADREMILGPYARLKREPR